ncbi:hypothetical protein FJ444_09925 [Aestuariibacter sp. GS-14]|uniref:multiheme c-type cytochrome n=1 Tax=Aestuariibacter sp. GS-14 TaxID=2590670 RepID=UPI00112B0A9A|nr:multiheme c-type cytochrome [Aestuariibacter sp. GS-14]TPV58350.1 hypothetical protein FJ444_09925 [Aestuariibacter sp. GS-14]
MITTSDYAQIERQEFSIKSLICSSLLVILLFITSILSCANGNEIYVGAQACISCHKSQGDAWSRSDHFQSMQPATPDYVLGDFSDFHFTAGKRTTRFYKQGEHYLIETLNEKGKAQSYPVQYVFGYYPLQQYLLETEEGRLQAFDVAWDSRPVSDGGQRWYQLQDDSVTDPDHPFFWTGYYQNWNSRCAACHTTDFAKQFNADTNQYQSTWTDINVACESCHGPGKEHITRVKSKTYSLTQSGLQELGKKLAFHFSEGDPIARSTGNASETSLTLNICGACHSRRAELQEPITTAPYHQQFQLEGLNEPLYFSDGQIRDEVFVLGSFLQSKMATAGVTCTNCHDPHSGDTILPGAQVCSTCHAPDVFAQPLHTNNHEGADCLDCHMPERIYMGVDARRDHRFHRPSSKHPNSGSPCLACHTKESEEWVSNALVNWPKRKGASTDTLGEWAAINNRLSASDPTAVLEAIMHLNNTNLPVLESAALVEKIVTFAPREIINSVFDLARDEDPLARQSAARAAANLPETERYKIWLTLSQDPMRSVRSVVASTILSDSPEWFTRSPELTALLDEYQRILLRSQDHPGANLGLASIATYKQDLPAAIKFYEFALTVDPQHIPSLLSYADFLRNVGKEAKARELLQRALKYGSDIASVQFAYGLQQIRDKDYQAAIAHLRLAANSDDAVPRFSFVFAVALWQQNQRQQAVTVLAHANTRWPGNYDVLLTWAKYAYQLRDKDALRNSLEQLGYYYQTDPTYLQLQHLIQ